MKKFLILLLMVLTMSGCTINHIHQAPDNMYQPTEGICSSSVESTENACPLDIPSGSCYDWALEHGVPLDGNGECPAYSIEDNGRCYPN